MKLRICIVLGLLILFVFGGACSRTETSEPEPEPNTVGQINAYTKVDEVYYGKPNNLEKLLEPIVAKLSEGDLVEVKNKGIAVITIANAYSVELYRNGSLQLREAESDGFSALLKLSQNAGVSLNDFHPEEAVASRLQIDNDYLVVTATGTYFLIMEEENTPLQWVVALPDPDSKLRVTANNTTAPVPAGKAVWVAPIGPPGPVFEADMLGVYNWIGNLRAGQPVSEFGEVVWAPANVEVPMQDFPDSITVSEPIVLNGIAFTFDPQGFYEKTDCNGDGSVDVHVQNGRIQLDFRQVIGQVRNIALEIVNHQPDTPLTLNGFNPADEIISEAQMTTTQANEAEILTLFSPMQPFHYADLEIAEACLAGVRLLPPDGEPQITTPTPITPEAPTDTPTPSPTACVPSPPADWVQYFVQSGDTLFNLANRTGVSIDTISRINCLQGTTIVLGQPLWLPFIPPTLTPTPNCNIPVTIEDVYEYEGVQIGLDNLPANLILDVYEGKSGTQGINGTKVGEINTGNGGYISQSFPVPENLYNETTIDIRVEARDSCLAGWASFQFRPEPCEITTADIVDPPSTLFVAANNLQLNSEYFVYIISNQKSSPQFIDSFNSGSSSSMNDYFTIPTVHLQSPTLQVALAIPETESYCIAPITNHVPPTITPTITITPTAPITTTRIIQEGPTITPYPDYEATAASEEATAQAFSATQTAEAQLFELLKYIVQQGDTIFSIASKFGVSSQELMTVNKISDPDSITNGQILVIPPND